MDDEDLLYSVALKGNIEMLNFIVEYGTGPSQSEYINRALESASEGAKPLMKHTDQ